MIDLNQDTGLNKHRLAERRAIIDKYGEDAVKADISRLCRNCQNGIPPWGRCGHGLLPINIDGLTCIYRRKAAGP